MERFFYFLLGAAAIAIISAGSILYLTERARTCEQWAMADGLTGESVVIVCQTGKNATGDMSRSEYRDRVNSSLTEVKAIIDSIGGL